MSTESDQELELRAAPALQTAVPQTHISAGLATTTTSPAMSQGAPGASHTAMYGALPDYSEASSSSIAVAPEPSSSAPFSQASTSTAITGSSDSFFDIAPRNDSTSFQVGYLGLKGFQAWLKGDVLVKLDAETKAKGRYIRCTVKLQAIEQVPADTSSNAGASDEPPEQQHGIEFFAHTLVLWDVANEATSSSVSAATVPPTMPFSFPLTADLPHCVHLRDSSVTYSITAQLYSEDTGKLPHAVKTVPVHLVRYTRPGRLDELELDEIDGAALQDSEYTLQPHNWIEQAPTLVYAQINRTIFRRAEPIEIRVRIPPPDPTSITEKGLRLRSVEADLVRTIRVKRPFSQGVDDDAGSKTVSTLPTALSSTPIDPHDHQALLAHSGKLCRFHSQRPVLLRLTLHPPFDRANMPHPHPDHDALASGPIFGRGGGGGCESISQETFMHKVSFEVRIKVGILGGRGERRDIVLGRAVRILPGAAGALEDPNDGKPTAFDALSEKERLKRSEKARMLAEVDLAEGSSSRSPAYANDLLDFSMDDEYDGYEDIGRSLNDLMGAADQSNVAGSSSQAMDHAERLEQLRQFLEVSDPSAHDDGPPPSLLESRNDLQVEVEVEGVGLAMPRHPHRHPADPYPNMEDPADSSFPPLPPIDGPTPQTMDAASHYAMIPLSSQEVAAAQLDHDDPPPPLSPNASQPSIAGEHHRSGGTDSNVQAFHPPSELAPARHALGHDGTLSLSPLPPSFLDLSSASSSVGTMQVDDREPHPSYEAAISDSTTRLPDGPGEASHQEPPPYIDGSNHADPAPSFDQAIRQHGSGSSSSSGLNTARSSASVSQAARLGMPQMPPQHTHQRTRSSVSSADHRPPAYGTSPHPPSYDG